ncbi:MAG: redoxin domain-containing protein [Bacteroidales bacterium]|nr:redoxin domain-containing protein [Bacteroidales bacterium]
MKKLVTLLLALALGFGLKAQCPLNQAVDFTATDCHGTEVHLFDILDGGQYVLIDFFFVNCGPCQQATPKVVESYYAMGCNMHDVFYMEISDRDSDAACQNWCQNYGVEYPTIGGPAGGSGICNTYQIGAFPTVILIAPDRQILINDLWPISNAQTVINALEQHGLQQHDCNTPSYNPQVSITVDQVLETEVTATFTPNEDCASYGYMMATEAEIQEWMGIAGLDLPEYLWTYGIPGSGELSNTFGDLEPNTEYVIYAVPADIDGNLGEVVQVPVTTTPGSSYEILPDFTGTDIDGNEIHIYDILDGGQWMLIHFFLVDDSYDFMPYLTESYRLFGCNEHDVFYMEVTPNGYDDAARAWAEQYGVEYPTISRTGGANTFVQDIPVGFYPTVMLINPNHEIVVRDIYPIIDTQTIIDAMESEGIEQHPCYEETLTFSMDTVNIVDSQYEINWITVYNNTTEDAIVTNIHDGYEYLTFIIDGEEIYCYEPIEISIPQGESKELGVVCNVVAKGIVSDIVTLTSNLPDASFVVVLEEPWSVDENEASVTLFPNPANDFVTLKGESLGTVRVYNTLGQKMDEFEANDSELRINTTGYESGVYVVKTGEKMMKFVVKH